MLRCVCQFFMLAGHLWLENSICRGLEFSGEVSAQEKKGGADLLTSPGRGRGVHVIST